MLQSVPQHRCPPSSTCDAPQTATLRRQSAHKSTLASAQVAEAAARNKLASRAPSSPPPVRPLSVVVAPGRSQRPSLDDDGDDDVFVDITPSPLTHGYHDDESEYEDEEADHDDDDSGLTDRMASHQLAHAPRRDVPRDISREVIRDSPRRDGSASSPVDRSVAAAFARLASSGTTSPTSTQPPKTDVAYTLVQVCIPCFDKVTAADD